MPPMSDVLERFLRYVKYDTQSNERSKTYPSTDKQLVLLRDLAAELRDVGLHDAAIDDYGYVMATVPATTTRDVPTIGFIEHGPIRVAFTPDEEVGRGTEHFDVARFGAACAYTMDGGERGEIEMESFSADAMTVTFQGL